MKKKIFTLVTLALLSIGSAWASTVDDLVTISSNYTFTASTVNSGQGLVGGTLYDSDRILSVGGNGWNNNGYQVKNNRQIAFKVSGPCTVSITFRTNSTRQIQLGKTTTGTDYGTSTTSPSEHSVTAAGVLYINASSDLYVQSFTVTFPSNDKPYIGTQPADATYEAGSNATALSVAATASAGTLSYQWYSNTDGDTSGKDADKIIGATAATLPTANISTATVGTYYYYCIVTDGNGSTTSSKATINVVSAFPPIISYASATNTVTITPDGQGGGTIYYTLDNSEPTASSTAYSAPFVLTNTSTIRAITVKNGLASEIAFSNCYVDHSATALAVLGFGDGTHASGVWTSTDGNYKLTSSDGNDIQYYTIFNGSDGFKLNHTNAYTFKVSDNIKVTSIKFVGKSRGDAVNNSTIAFDGFTPESGTIEKGTFVKTIEFTPSSPLSYGASIEITTGGNQFGGYIEVYGEEYAKNTTIYETTTWDFTNWSDATIAGLKADTENWNPYEKANNGGLNFEDNGRSLAISRSNNSLSYGDPGTKIAETDGLIFNTNEKTYQLALIFDKKEVDGMSPTGGYNSAQYMWLYGGDAIINIENVTKGSIIEIGLETHKKENGRGLTLTNSKQTQGDAKPTAYQVCKWEVTSTGTVTITPNNGGLHIYYIKLDKAAKDAITFTPVYDKTTFVTPKALDFTGVEGLKAYVATGTNSNGVKISEVTAPVPAGTPLLLIGTANTEYTVPAVAEDEATAPSTNLLMAGDGTTEFNGQSQSYDYILGGDGMFHRIASGKVATNKAYLHLESAPSTRSLVITFDDTTDGIDASMMDKGDMIMNKVFDLQGRRVVNPTKGLYIVGGKKMMVK